MGHHRSIQCQLPELPVVEASDIEVWRLMVLLSPEEVSLGCYDRRANDADIV